MLFKRPDLTAGSRPLLLPDETLLFVQNGVGLYEGKYKIATCQKGQAYLTSHRAVYVDDNDARENSLAIDLRDVDRYEYQAGFLRSSPKVTLYAKEVKRGVGSPRPRFDSPTPRSVQQLSSSSPVTRTSSPFRSSSVRVDPVKSIGTWVCPICSFSNPVPSNFDSSTATPSFPLLGCLACGIPPPYPLVLKAAISAATNRASNPAGLSADSDRPGLSSQVSSRSLAPEAEGGVVICPRCTYHNHRFLHSCEICGAQLPSAGSSRSVDTEFPLSRPESPGPLLADLNINENNEIESVKFSFREGGEKVFYERLKGAIIQRKWLLQGAPPAPRPQFQLQDEVSDNSDFESQGNSRPLSTPVGIAGLERRGLQTQKKNEVIIGGAFEDLEALMASAKDIVALAEKFAQESGAGTGFASNPNPLVSESAAALGMVTTRDMLGGSDTLYISELSRNLAEYLTDDKRGLLRSQGGTMSLIDLWAVFNRSRNGVELISPSDFQKASQMWEKLSLPVRLRQFKSGLLAVQRRDWTDEKTIGQLKTWLGEAKRSQNEVPWDMSLFGHGITAQQAAQRFGWSIGVASEELEMAEDRGVLCREEGIEGLRFWFNYFLEDPDFGSLPTNFQS